METTPQPSEDAPVIRDTSVRPVVYWKLQSVPEVTTPQRIFDIVVGIAAPIVCLILDPVVFKTWPIVKCETGSVLGFLGQYQIWAYAAIGFGSVTLLLWLIAGTHIKQWASVIAGILLAGFVCALFIGIKLLPGSLMGLQFVLGILGFTPFFTAFVYLHNSVKATRYFRRNFEGKAVRLIAGMLAGMLVALGTPTLVQWQADRLIFQAIEGVLTDNDTSAQQGEHTLRILCSVCPVCYLQYTARYLIADGKTDGIFSRDDRLDAIYEEITGTNALNCSQSWD